MPCPFLVALPLGLVLARGHFFTSFLARQNCGSIEATLAGQQLGRPLIGQRESSQFSRELIIPRVAYILTLAAFLKTEKLEMAKKSTPWSIDEVTTFLHLIADDKIQRELDGTTRNLNVFQEVSALLSVRGYARTFQQCRDKVKKLKSEY